MHRYPLGTVTIAEVTDDDLEPRIRMLLALATRQLERGDLDAARATMIALEADDFGRGARDAEAPLSVLRHRPTSDQELRVVLRVFWQLLPPAGHT